MPRKPKIFGRKVFFNASVVLAGLRSPAGGSGRLLSFAKDGKIDGVISEIVLDEVLRHAGEVGLNPTRVRLSIAAPFRRIQTAPAEKNVSRLKKVVIDPGDAHVLASGREAKTDFLVTLDKRRLLILQKKIKWIKVVSPGELIEILSKNR